MATKFKIKKVNPSVPVFTSYVACPTTCDEGYVFSDGSSTCIEDGYYGSCDECCPEPEPDPGASNTLIFNQQTPNAGGQTTTAVNWEIDGVVFFNTYVRPYLYNFAPEVAFTMYHILGEVTSPISTTDDLIEYGQNGDVIQFGVPYTGIYSTSFSEAALNTGFGNVVRGYGFVEAGIYSVILHDYSANKFLVLNNLFEVLAA